MARARTIHRCSECGSAFSRWSGRCGSCGEWNTLVEELEQAASPLAVVPGAGGEPSSPAQAAALAAAGALQARRLAAGCALPASGPVLLGDVDLAGDDPLEVGVPELDRVLGGGLVPGSVTLLGGEPGIGKSTLLLECAASAAARGATTLIVAAEESAQQVRRRAERLGSGFEGVHIVATTDLAAVFEAVAACTPSLLVVDSIQTIADRSLGSAAGTVVQVRGCAAALVQLAKATGIATILVGHVTKDGALAGPRALEHVVDTVLSFEGDRHHGLRMLSACKHRFGSTGELGIFEMTDGGLRSVADASGFLLSDRRPGIPGSVIVPVAEGKRPLLVEVQALVAQAAFGGPPRRSVQGLQGGRLAMIIALVEKARGESLAKHDVFASVVGGVKVAEPAADLGLALALASASADRPVPEGVVAFGEVGLGAEVRQVGQTNRRLAEAQRLGYRCAVVAASSPNGPPGLDLVRVSSLHEAIAEVLGPRHRAAGHGRGGPVMAGLPEQGPETKSIQAIGGRPS